MANDDAKFQNESDFLGSLYYKINAMTGFLLYTPDQQQTAMYSDLKHGTGHVVDYLTGETMPDLDDAWNYLVYDNTVFINVKSAEEYETIKPYYTLFGLSWLPWFPPPSDGNGGRIFRRDLKSRVRFNKARWEVLEPTLMTVGKLTAAALLGLYGGKLAFNQIRRRWR